MTRRTTGFISKRPHKKSRGGCTTCKKKKVKCDEILPRCTYCAQRNFECGYPHANSRQTSPSTPASTSATATPPSHDSELGDPATALNQETLRCLIPAAQTSIGDFTAIDFEMLNHYQATTWTTVTVRTEEPIVEYLTKTWVPQTALSKPYLLYCLLSIAAAHSNNLAPTPQKRKMSDIYRHQSFSAYNAALGNITNDNYETLLMTSMYMQVMVLPPSSPCSDAEMLSWVSSLMQITQGIRLIAGLKWSCGFENLNIFPLFKRELRTLPPPPMTMVEEDIGIGFCETGGRYGDSPQHPNPPATYSEPVNSATDMPDAPFIPQDFSSSFPGKLPWQTSAPVFLPPSLMALLRSIAIPPTTGPIDLHRGALLPSLHAFSPIFLSLYHFHLSSDLYVRITVFPTFLTKEFLTLVSDQEPRAMVIVAWWFAFMKLLPTGWWLNEAVPRVVQSVSNLIIRSNNKLLMDAVEGAYRAVRLVATKGKEDAARSMFDGWQGMQWEYDNRHKEPSGRIFEMNQFSNVEV